MWSREIAIHERKIRKARAKRNEDLARRLRARKPTYKLDHLVKERYGLTIAAAYINQNCLSNDSLDKAICALQSWPQQLGQSR